MKRFLALVLAGAMALSAGCILDSDDDSKDDTDAARIGELTMGGGVFYFPQENYALAQFGVFDGSLPFENARVFVNGLELQNQMGVFSNAQPITESLVNAGSPVRIAVYAFGDSVVKTLALPPAPVIRQPAAGTELTVGKDLTIQIEYPGNHQIVSMTLGKQADVATAVETSETLLTVPVPGNRITTAGASMLTAISSNASGPVPQNFNINNQYSIFLASTVTTQTYTVKAVSVALKP